MAIQFFTFGNNETYQFFQWLGESGEANRILTMAFAHAETEERLKMGHDVRFVVRDNLAKLLATSLEFTVGDLSPEQEILETGAVRDPTKSLWWPILEQALKKIDCVVVAEALLRQAGNWAPSTESPEMR